MVDGSCIGELESGDQDWVAVVAVVLVNVGKRQEKCGRQQQLSVQLPPHSNPPTQTLALETEARRKNSVDPARRRRPVKLSSMLG